MGVIYKLREDVVQFIIEQRQGNPLLSCRQLAEAVLAKYSVSLSKSSVHDVLKEAGVITPRGRKPYNKFEIPQEKKKQIQTSLSQVKWPPQSQAPTEDVITVQPQQAVVAPPEAKKQELEVSDEYEGAGKVFLKAVWWDLGLPPEAAIKEKDWDYYLTYCKGIQVLLENGQGFFIDLPVPIERGIKETVDGLVNNTKPLVLARVSDKELLDAAVEGKQGFKISKIQLVEQKNHIIVEFSNIVEYRRRYLINNRLFVDSYEHNIRERLKKIFFLPDFNPELMEEVLNMRGIDHSNEEELKITLLAQEELVRKSLLEQAVEKINAMFLRDELNRLVSVSIKK